MTTAWACSPPIRQPPLLLTSMGWQQRQSILLQRGPRPRCASSPTLFRTSRPAVGTTAICCSRWRMFAST
ncbi:hypothetical protein HU200_017797 [Digitaria exilis]|uniref:Uncharacterized protein n=1 Tax=Digitaria exilis TaxID=1010633 RepID=A0A835F6H6_9POAL|nr:hypothetical protein HU200_017797 [Digitaria exilis]